MQGSRKHVPLSERKAILEWFSGQGKQPSKKLVDLATDMVEKKGVLPNEKYIKVWAPSGRVCQSKDRVTVSSQRLCGIMRNIDALENNMKLTTCAFRLSLLLLFHLVEQNVSLVDKSKLRQGCSRKTVVFEELAQQNMVDLKKLKERFRRASKYFLVAEKGGIGSLLVVGNYPTR